MEQIKHKLLCVLGILANLAILVEAVSAEAPRIAQVSQVRSSVVRAAPFQVPPRLRARVDFWIDIFTKYGKDQVVIHHREYPQATFGVLDFSSESADLNPVQLEKLKRRRINDAIDQVRSMVKKFAAGELPRTNLEQRVYDAMRLIPGESRFRRVLSDPESIRSQTGIKEKYVEALRRSGQYIEEMERIFTREFGLPKELTRLPFIESSFDYKAYSSVGAAGIWQFMRRTGMLYLTINKIVDERRDPLIATRAAARYLQHAYEELGTWPLAVTSYNHGIVGVMRKARNYGTTDLTSLIENGYSERPFGFASTNFFPEFLAALDVYDSHYAYFPGVRLDAPIDFKILEMPRAVSVQQISRELKVQPEDLRSVNLALAESVWSGRLSIPKGYRLRVPTEATAQIAHVKEEQFISAEPTVKPSKAYSAAVYKVRKGDTLVSIAKQFHVSLEDIKAMNDIDEEDGIRIGQQISIPREKESIKAQDTEVYKVKSGDTLHEISKRFGVSVAKIRAENSLSSTRLSVGQKLVIPKLALHK